MTPAQTLVQAQIAALIPHSGTMCLLQTLDAWDKQHIVCRADNHRDPHNPLRTRSGLLAPSAIEYAAQAMALHGALIGLEAGVPASPGYLASTRGVQLHRLRLDDLAGELHITPPARPATRARSSTPSRSATPASRSPKVALRSCSTPLSHEHHNQKTRPRDRRQRRARQRHRDAPGA